RFQRFILARKLIELACRGFNCSALTAVIHRVVSGIINPLIAMLGGQPSLGHITITINNAVFQIGSVIDALITFVIIAAAVYFVIVVPMNKIIERRKAGEEPEPEPGTPEAELLTEIRDLLNERRYVTTLLEVESRRAGYYQCRGFSFFSHSSLCDGSSPQP